MNALNTKILGVIILVLLSFLGIKHFVSTPPEKTVKIVKEYTEKAKKLNSVIDKEEKDFHLSKYYSIYKDRPSFKLLDQNFDKARKVADTLKIDIKTLNKELDNYSRLSSGKLDKAQMKVFKDFKELNGLLSEPRNYLKELEKLEKNLDKQTTKIYTLLKSVEIDYHSFQKLVQTYQEKYPNKKDDLAKKEAEITKYVDNMQKSVDSIKEETKKVQKDIVKIQALISFFLKNESQFNDRVKKYTKLIKSLDKEYTKILIDMKSRPYIVVERTSWDNYYDYPTEHVYKYKIYLSPEEFKYFSTHNEQMLATYKSGLFGGNSFKPTSAYDSKYVYALRISPKKGWPNGDDEAEFWIADLGMDYYHKYKIIENGKIYTTGWVKVDEATYQKNIKNLGMAIISKPKGKYETEVSNIPEPPGMSFVGNPHYGEWKTDNNGHSFWYYYGMYSFFSDLLGGNHYSRNDYNNYRSSYSSHKPYYGNGRYGTLGRDTKKGLRNSTFSRTGGFKRAPKIVKAYSSRSYRNIGSHVRGRGPGGGGK